MRKLYRILGKKGRITIPYEIRSRVGFSYNDVLSFTEQDDRTVVVRREKICGDCRSNPKTPTEKVSEGITLLQFLDDLSKSEQRAALIHLSVKWAEQQEEDSHAYADAAAWLVCGRSETPAWICPAGRCGEISKR